MAMILLSWFPPSSGSQFSFCILKLLGFDHCPGCGIGHAMGYFIRGNFTASFESHPLGSFAVIIIMSRIYTLLRLHIFPNKNYKNISP